jgi:hypothetical protein
VELLHSLVAVVEVRRGSKASASRELEGEEGQVLGLAVEVARRVLEC